MTAQTQHVLSVADVLERPGASRPVDVSLPLPEGLDLATVTIHEPLRLTGVVESLVDGLLVRGSVRARLTLGCARCLIELTDELRADVAELFTHPGAGREDHGDEPGYEITGDHVDLDMLLRDAVAPAVFYRRLCRSDCLGLCASCGANLNDGRCGCEHTVVDTRWKALEELDLSNEI